MRIFSINLYKGLPKKAKTREIRIYTRIWLKYQTIRPIMITPMAIKIYLAVALIFYLLIAKILKFSSLNISIKKKKLTGMINKIVLSLSLIFTFVVFLISIL